MSFSTPLTLTEVSQIGWDLSQVLARKQHNPAQLAATLDEVADRAVVLHAAGNSRAITLAIFAAQATPAAVEAAITALV